MEAAEIKYWYFTLASNQGGPGCVKVAGTTWDHARARMINAYGLSWAFQYNCLEDVHPLDRTILGKLEII